MNFEEYVFIDALTFPSHGYEEIDVEELIRFLQKKPSIKHLGFYGHKNLVETLKKMKQADLKSLDKLILYITAEEGKDAIPPLAEIGRSNVGLTIGIRLAGDLSASKIKVLVETKGFYHIQYLKLLHRAYSYTPIDIEGVRILANSESVQGLKYLDLYSNKIGNDALKLLTQSQYLANLEDLSLYNCYIKNAELLAQPSMKNLKHLDISYNPLSPSSIEKLAKSPHMSQLESLHLPDCSAIEVAKALSQMANLKQLIIDSSRINALSVVEKLVERKFDYLRIKDIVVRPGIIEADYVTSRTDFYRFIMDLQSAREMHTMLDANTVKQRVFEIAAKDNSEEIIKHIVDRPNKYHFLINSRNADKNSLLHFYNNNLGMKKFLFSRGMIPDPEGEGTGDREGEVVDVRLQEIARDSQSVHFKEPIEKMKFFTRMLVKRIGINHDGTKQAADSFVSSLSTLRALHRSNNIRVVLFPLTQNDKEDIVKFSGSGLKSSDDKKDFIKFIFDNAKRALNTAYLKKSQGRYGATYAEVYDDNSGAKITIPESIGYIQLLIDTYDPLLKARKDLLVDLATKDPELIEQKLPEIRSSFGNNDISLEQITDPSKFHELLQDIDGDRIDSLFKQISDLDIKEVWKEQAKIALLKGIFEASLVGKPNEFSCSQGAWIRIIASLEQIDPEFTAEFSQHLGNAWEEIKRNGIDDAKGKEIAKSLAQELVKHVRKQPKLKEALNNLFLTQIDIIHPEQITLEQQQILAKINQEFIQRYLGNNKIPKNADYQMVINGFFNNKEIDTFIQQGKLDETSKTIKALDEQGQITRNREALKTEIKKLIEGFKENDTDINIRNSEGETLLHLAVRIGDKSLVSDLLSEGASFDVQSDKHLTPVGLSRVKEISDLLIRVEAAFSAASDGFSMILLKVEINNSGDVQALAKAKNGDGHTLLSLVVSRKSNLLEVQEKRLEIIDLLVDKGADINFKDAQGNSLLHTAIRNTDKEVVDTLLSRGAVIDDATKLIVDEMKTLPNPNEDIKAILEKLEQHTLDKMHEDIKAILEKLEKYNEDIEVILEKLEKNNEDVKAILEKLEQHTLGKLFPSVDPCSSSTQKRKKRQPCDNSDLEEAWKEIKDFLQKKVEPISELQAQLTSSESFVISAYKGIDLLVNNLRQGAVVDLEITIDQCKRLSTFAKKVFIRHDDLQKEAKQDIDNMQRSVSRIKTGAEIYHSNQNDFDSIFNSREQSLAGLNQKIEDYRTGIAHLESAISNFDLLISRTEAALPIFKEVKIISIRVGSRLKSLPNNSNNRALLSLDHQKDIARLQQLKESIRDIQDMPQGVKNFLQNKLEEVNQKTAQLSSCLQSGGRRKRAAGGGCEIIDESIESISRNLDNYMSERSTIRLNIIDATGSLLRGGSNAMKENIRDAKLFLDLQNSYLDSVSSAIALHRSKNRHNGAVLDEGAEQQLNLLESKALEGRRKNAELMSNVTALEDSILAFEKIREIKERLNPKLLKDLSGEEITSLIDSELEKVEVVKKELARIIEGGLERTVRTSIKNKFEQEIQRVNKKVSDIQSFASLMQEIDRFDIRKKSLYESTREINSEGITYGKKINDLRDELFSNIVGLIDDFNDLKLDPNLIRQAPDFIKERVKVFKNDISYLKSIKAEVSTTKSFSIDELFDDISSSTRDYHTHGESLELSQVGMSYKRLHAVAYFLENNFDINTRDSNGRTFLHLAAEMGSDEYLISLLLEKGAMFDAKDNDGKSPLDLLRTNAMKLDIGGVELLESIERAFHFVSMGDFDSVDNLLKESSEDYIRALVKVKNSSGNTLLYEAVAKEQANQENQVKIIDLLIKNGAADGLQDPNGKSTLYVAIKNKGEKIIDFLLKKGAVVDDATIEFAKQNSNEAIVNKLEQHVLGEFTQCSPGSSRVKREVGDCISWEDIDEFNEAEEQDRRNPEKIEINSEKFLDYLKEVQGEKRSALLELADKVGEERVDGRFKGVVNKLTSNQKAMSHLNRVGKVSGVLMDGMMGKAALGALLRGDYKGVAINLGFIAGGKGLAKVAEAASMKGIGLVADGKLFLGRSLRMASPFLARGASAFIAYDLYNQIKEYKNGNPDALVGIVGDSISLGVDGITAVVEVAGVFIPEMAEIAVVLGPIGAAVVVMVFVGTDIYLAVKRVDKENKIIPLTGWEKFTEGGRAFIGMNPDSKIQELMEEKEANNLLVQQGLEFLKNNTDIQAYVFPTGKLVVVECHTVEHREETNWWCGNFPTTCGGGTASWIGEQHYLVTKSEKCTTKLQLDLDNTVNLFTKRTDIKWSRASPDGREDGGSFVCYPKGYYWSIPAHGAYLCENAIGVRSLTNGTGPIFVSLGEGTDDFIGSPNNPHIIIVEKGNKTLDAGRENDLVMPIGSDISGILDGRGGIDTLDLGNFAPGEKVEVNLDNHYIKYQGISDNVLRAEGFENVLGRKKEAEKTYTTCETQYTDGRGGKSDKERDLVVMDKKNCSYKMQTAVRPFTDVENYANGTFGYNVNRGPGRANVNLFSSTAQHNFVFNFSLSEIESINKTKNRVTFSLGDVDAESRFNITILEPTKGGKNVSYYFSDNSKIVFEGRNVFALQNTNRSISELIDNYLPIVNRLGIYFSAQSGSESIVIAHKNNDVIESNPDSVTHLIGGDGKNVYVINPGSKLPLSRSKLPLPKAVTYYFDRENTGTATIDFRSVLKEVYDKLCKHINYKVMQGDSDLVVTLECSDHGGVSGGENYYISTVELKGGVSWYNRVHVMVENVPVKIEQLPSRRNHSEWTFTPLPLHFGEEYNIIYISTHDVLRNHKIHTHRKVGEYKLLKDKDNLVITCEDKYSVIIENFFKNPVMQTLKVDFNDQEINLAEIDRSNITELNDIKNLHKKRIDTILNEFRGETETISNSSKVNETATHKIRHKRRHKHSRHKHQNATAQQRNRRAINEESIASSATRSSNPINNLVNWVKNSIGGLFNSRATLPENNTTQSLLSQVDAQVNVDGAILLLDLFIRKITGENYVSSVNQDVSLLGIQADALNITKEFGKILSTTLNTPAEELIDLPKVQSKIFKAMKSGRGNEILGILCSYVKEANLEPEVTKKILSTFQPTKPTASTLESQTKHLSPLPNASYHNEPKSSLSSITMTDFSNSLACR